mmetsp:Transcript_107899/g.344404  ORF Transcript_107899/g.344404 Transcript_107899/m.344404 type:complete len:123 (-) Transcript_107899:131-499(-)|eukprot:CAMPEP_0177466686 /NCGR_PEP_ID=MMETSP0369-20130122/18108_1 /TAXON_ID=447022 ORGANISM="Scrippsiella hangoei-like, Strain SHHI-4" /NCGR_SAMPLE_ID=MMETSP0369 /ASSEMBLY_ACC=CAM_ASM_000364 /LENGTH=122 /DNA_ID=CAMNT_0018940711 /DNA_START=201 /DNA_END=569 /DNA_ORIENTATION=-
MLISDMGRLFLVGFLMVLLVVLIIVVAWQLSRIHTIIETMENAKVRVDPALMNMLCPVERLSRQPPCVVCLEEIEDDSPCRRLQCSHSFHAECLESWWANGPKQAVLKCPLCRHHQQLMVAV